MRRALPTSEERKKERETFNHQCSFLPTSQSTLHIRPYLIPLGARVTPTKASPRVHPPLVHFSSLPFFRGEKSSKKKRHEDASTPSSSRRRRRPRDDDRVARVSRHGAAFRAVRDRGTACGAHLFFFFFFFASRFGCVSLSLFRAPSSTPFVAHRKVAFFGRLESFFHAQ